MPDDVKSDNAEALVRIRFLFWKHLTWQQRVAILQKLNSLEHPSEIPSSPIPQPAESMLLERLRRLGKVHELWELVRPLLPADAQQTDPFVSKMD